MVLDTQPSTLDFQDGALHPIILLEESREAAIREIRVTGRVGWGA